MTTPDLTTALPTSPRPTGLLPWPEETTRALEAAGLDPRHVAEIADRTLAEDLSWGPDVTSEATLPADATGTADVAVRQPRCLAGVPRAAPGQHPHPPPHGGIRISRDARARRGSGSAGP